MVDKEVSHMREKTMREQGAAQSEAASKMVGGKESFAQGVLFVPSLAFVQFFWF